MVSPCSDVSFQSDDAVTVSLICWLELAVMPSVAFQPALVMARFAGVDNV